VLLWGVISFAQPEPYKSTDTVPVDVISEVQFSEMMAGIRHARKAETPKPVVEKVAERNPTDNLAAKPVEKKLVTTTASAPPSPEPQVVEPPPSPPMPTPRSEPKREEAIKPEPKQDVESLKKAEKPEPKKEEVKIPTPPKKPEPPKQEVESKPTPPKPQPKFDPSRIAALLDKREPERIAAAGDVLSRTATLGTTTGTAPRLSQSALDALRSRLKQCWNPPAGAFDGKELIVLVRVQFKVDGSLAAEPVVLNRGAHAYFQVAAEAALRGIRRCAPYDFLPATQYEAWKDIEINFDPSDMFGAG
jgi:hypothetical protein